MLPPCHLTTALPCHLTIAIPCHRTTLPSYRRTTLPSYRLTIARPYHRTTLPSHYLATPSHHLAILPSHHLGLPSHHLTILPPPYLARGCASSRGCRSRSRARWAATPAKHTSHYPIAYLATSLPHYLTTSPPHHLNNSLPPYLATSLPSGGRQHLQAHRTGDQVQLKVGRGGAQPEAGALLQRDGLRLARRDQSHPHPSPEP